MDLIENGTEPSSTPDPSKDLTWTHPSALGVTSVALAFLSVMGASVFRGVTYTAYFAEPERVLSGDTSGSTSFLVTGAFLTAAFALLPIALSLRGLRTVVADDGTWTPHLLRAGLLLGLVSLVLHLAQAVLATTSDQPLTGYLSLLAG